MWAGAGASLCPHVHKEVLPKNQKEQRTKNEHGKKSLYFLDGIQCRRYILGGIQYRRYLLGGVRSRQHLLAGIQCWRYHLGGIENWRCSFGGIECWRYFFSGSGKTKIWRNFFGGNVLAVGGFSYFGGNDFGGRRYYQNMAVNRHIAGTAHQGDNFTCLLYTSPSPRD